MKVLVIPEDQELDQYIVRPVAELLLWDVGLKAKVEVLPEPRLRGASQALSAAVIGEIVSDNPMVDLFLLFVDRDCNRDENESRAERREREHLGKLLACCAWQEVEVWMLSAYKELLGVPWQEVRKECDPKERFAELVLQRVKSSGPGRGRKAAMRAASVNSLLTCDELVDLRSRLVDWRDARG